MSVDRPPLVPDIDRKQRNILPHDLIANDRDMNDLLWNGTAKPSRIQTAGAVVMGLMLLFGGLGTLIIAVQRGSWIGIFPTGLIAAAGLRIIYRNLKPRKAAEHNRKGH